MKLINFIIASLLVASVLPVHAETKTFIKEYAFQASEDDSRNSSRTIALREVKRLLLEELGTYLESETEVHNFQLTRDQIITLTAGIVKTEIVDEKWDGQNYWLEAKIEADPDKVTRSLDTLRRDRTKIKELEKMRKRSDELLKENERLRKELEVARGDRKKKETISYNKTIKELTEIEWIENGGAYYISGNYKDAIVSFSKAIELNPKDAEHYVTRGVAYHALGNYTQAINDYSEAVKINPRNAHAYYNRALAYDGLGDNRQALRDYNKAIQLNPRNPDYYVNRGIILMALDNYRQAMKDFDIAIEIDPQDAIAYHNRGINNASLGNFNQAIEDFDKAIELNPKYSKAYSGRGMAYEQVGNHNQAIENYRIAARLGEKRAQDLLRNRGIAW